MSDEEKWRQTPLAALLNTACTGILMRNDIKTLGELHDLGSGGLDTISDLSTMEIIQIRQNCRDHGHPLPINHPSTQTVETSPAILAQGQAPEIDGKHQCAVAHAKVTEAECIKLSSDSIKSTQCRTAKCTSRWRICHLCMAQGDNEVLMHMPEARTSNPENGLCKDHDADPAFRRVAEPPKTKKKDRRTAPHKPPVWSAADAADQAALTAQAKKDTTLLPDEDLEKALEHIGEASEFDEEEVETEEEDKEEAQTPETTTSKTKKGVWHPMSKDILDKAVSALRLDFPHIVTPLKNAGFETIRDLTASTRETIMNSSGISARRIATVAKKLSAHGLAFKDEKPVKDDSAPTGPAPSRQLSAAKTDGTPLKIFFSFYKLRKRLADEFGITTMEELEERFDSLNITHPQTRAGIERALAKFRKGKPAGKSTGTKSATDKPTAVSAELIPATPMDGASPLTRSLVGAINPLVGSDVEGIELTARFRTPDHKRFRLQVAITPEPD